MTLCVYCGQNAGTRDHVYPRSRGGTLTVHCCGPCNQAKRDMDPVSFFKAYPWRAREFVLRAPLHVPYPLIHAAYLAAAGAGFSVPFVAAERLVNVRQLLGALGLNSGDHDADIRSVLTELLVLRGRTARTMRDTCNLRAEDC